jgi:hypothetical protein
VEAAKAVVMVVATVVVETVATTAEAETETVAKG